ncbi:cobalamin biosynthesis protein [Nocardia sp. NPDC058658]|uniref:cobalamin biosynthesis protein n=1 Tax=Nocardia sp. NPDC058658 TaxID=3346580 RepID=UPI0036592361
MRKGTSTAAGLVLGFVLDRVFADPRRWHPVAGFGSAAAALEGQTYVDDRRAGVVHEVIAVGSVVGIGVLVARTGGASARSGSLVARAGGSSGRGTVLVTALATWTALGGRSLVRAGYAMADRLEAGDLVGARELLPSLCGRDPSVLDADGLARAALESIAENTSDAAVAPLLWGAVAGVPGLLGYRAINTLDAMIGYRNERYENFGWAAARVDDLANLVPARVTGLLTAVLAPLVGGTAGAALRAWRRDAAGHPSPNAGVVEASMAGALGIRLGGLTQYRHGIELRPTLGDGPTPTAGDLRRAVRMSAAVQVGAVGVAVVVRMLRGKG